MQKQNQQRKIRTVVMLSGSGSTLQNFIDRMESGDLPIEIVRVISSKRDVYGLERARKHGIPAIAIARRDYPSWEEFNQAITAAVDESSPDLILLAGYMSLFRPGAKYDGKIMNVHPALIPAFCGKGLYGHHVHQAVIEAGVRFTGATVHFVDQDYDTGPIILQRSCLFSPMTPRFAGGAGAGSRTEIYPERSNCLLRTGCGLKEMCPHSTPK